MKVISKGFDPELGKKFAEEHGSFVIMRGTAPAKKPEVEEMPGGLSEQEQWNWVQEHPGAQMPGWDEPEP